MLIRYDHCKLIKMTFSVPFTKNGIFKLTKSWLSPKGFCIVRSVTRIMVKTYNCCWWCSNALISIKISEFYLEIILLCLSWVQPWDIWQRNVQPGVGKFGCIWLEWFARGQGIWLQIFEKCQVPTPCPASPHPASFTLIGALVNPFQICLVSSLVKYYWLT